MKEKIPVTVLYVEDEAAIREAVAVFLRLNCETVITAADGGDALEKYRKQRPDLVITDIKMPGLDGMQLSARLRELDPQLPVIITTAFSEVPYLVRAIEVGVRGFIRKPIEYSELLEAVHRSAMPIIQQSEIARLKAERRRSFFPAAGQRLLQVAQQVEQVADGEYSALIFGEKGTGKTRCAKAIHAQSRRSKRPFITVSCRGAVAERLEVELFGKERGGIGRIMAASGGTLYLHDLTSAPLQTQAKLLRLLEEGRYLPVGGKTEAPCNARVLASLTGDPRKAVADGELLESLYFHLSDVLVRMPPLREMPEEIAPLARLFLAEGAEDTGRDVPQLADDAVRLLCGLQWPGNIRELKNLMRRSVLQSERCLTAAAIQPLLSSAAANPLAAQSPPPPSLSLEALERWAIEQALSASKGRKMKAAALLGIDYKRFQRKAARYGVAT